MYIRLEMLLQNSRVEDGRADPQRVGGNRTAEPVPWRVSGNNTAEPVLGGLVV
jgi:hypothetical protein